MGRWTLTTFAYTLAAIIDGVGAIAARFGGELRHLPTGLVLILVAAVLVPEASLGR
ncbi:hypothetical protein AAW51_5288 [Caldimonas brevitalea]|uniref:Uncharacterized protein n=1 Tax=Caldimonas brevitalea TaxID=413882 RepID=A0A0G3BRC6_9BURK|nr:hypothetical protein AAW51_5288 [Caldimonas brevitalea]